MTSVDAGTPADLEVFQLGDAAAGFTPYFIRIRVTNVTGGPFAYISLGLTTPVLGDGSAAQDLAVIYDYPKCPNEAADEAFATAGATFETCRVGLAGPGAEVTGLAYRGSAYGRVVDEPNYTQTPVFWQS